MAQINEGTTSTDPCIKSTENIHGYKREKVVDPKDNSHRIQIAKC
jgi:hypothetical protein